MLFVRCGYAIALGLLGACAPRGEARRPEPPPIASAPATPATSGRACDPVVPAASRAELSVHTDPPGAMVFWLGKLVGGTPLDRHAVEAGTGQLVLVLPRYEPLFETVTLKPSEHTLVKLAFSAPAPAAPAVPSGGGSSGADDSGGSGECGWGPCMEECRQDRFDCGSADLCEALYQGCIKRCRRHYHCY